MSTVGDGEGQQEEEWRRTLVPSDTPSPLQTGPDGNRGSTVTQIDHHLHNQPRPASQR